MLQSPASNRRRFERTAATIVTDIRYEGLDCTGFTADVSASGAFVRAGEDADPVLSLLCPGDCVELRLPLETPHPLRIQARVVHKTSWGVGFEFFQKEPRLDSCALLATLSSR